MRILQPLLVLLVVATAAAQTTTTTTLPCCTNANITTTACDACTITGQQTASVIVNTTMASTSTTTTTTVTTTTTTTTTTTSSTTTITTVTTTTGTTTTTLGGATWARALAGTGSDVVQCATVDSSGNSIVGGIFTSPTLTVGGSMLANAGAPNSDGFIVKYSPTGAVLWAKGVGGTGGDIVYGCAVDPLTDDVIVVGAFDGTTTWGGASFTSLGSRDAIVVRLSAAAGATLWTKRFGGTADDVALGVAVGSGGNIVVGGGFFSPTMAVGGTTLTVVVGQDSWVAKLDSSGTTIWAKNFAGNTGDDNVNGVAVDSAGNVAIGGKFTNGLSLGGATFHAFGGVPDGYVAVLTSAGAHVWSRQIGNTTTSSGEDSALGVAMDASGNVVVVGLVQLAVDFGNGVLTPAIGGSDAYVARYGAAGGAYICAKRFGSSSNDQVGGVAIDSGDQNAVVVGSFTSQADFGGTILNAFTSTNIYVAEYTSAACALVSARQAGGGSTDVGYAVAVGSGFPTVVGLFNGTGTYNGVVLTSAGLADGVVMRFSPVP